MKIILTGLCVTMILASGIISCGVQHRSGKEGESNFDRNRQIYAPCGKDDTPLASDFYRFDNNSEFQYYFNNVEGFNSPTELYVIATKSTCIDGVHHLVQYGGVHHLPIFTQKTDTGKTYYLASQDDAFYLVGDHGAENDESNISPICSGELEGVCDLQMSISEDRNITTKIRYLGETILEHQVKLNNVTKKVPILGAGGTQND